MILTVSGLDKANPRFTHLWGRYVLGFKPWTHCLECFKSKVARGINPNMIDGSYPLDANQQFFYLCGVGRDLSEKRNPGLSRQYTNVHLAVTPRLGSTAAIGSLYGVTFTITDAQAIPIQPLTAAIGLPKNHYRCKNFQFGYQTFNAKWVGKAVPNKIVYDLRAPQTD